MSDRFEDKLPAELVDDLRWVRKFIKDNPNRFNIDVWLEPGEFCGTVGCIAGHMACRSIEQSELFMIASDVAAARREAKEFAVSDFYCDGWKRRIGSLMDIVDAWRARAIPQDFEKNFNKLFIVDQWPDQFVTRKGNVTPRLAVMRIDHFMEHGE